MAEWTGAAVFEAGTGTGRVTRAYIEGASRAVCCDRSEHMLARARENLAAYAGRITFIRADNFDLPGHHDADLFVEGWSFGHSAPAEPDEAPEVARRLIRSLEQTLKPGGASVLIETLGTNTSEPRAPSEALARFYRLLEDEHGYKREELRTDYEFPSVSEAVRITGFFFGPAMAEAVRRRGSAIVQEWTGLWHRRH